jgi:hypothetical protein
VRVAIGLGASCLLGCSGGVLDVGSGDAGDPREAAPAVSVFSAAAVARAHQLCPDPKHLPTDPNVMSYAQADLRSELTGGWLLCSFRARQDAQSFQFTADGHWYTLVGDGDGGLRRAGPGYDGGAIGSGGPYTFQDGYFRPSGPGGPALYVATNGVTWFHPEFTPDGPARLMFMNFTDMSQDTCVLIGP